MNFSESRYYHTYRHRDLAQARAQISLETTVLPLQLGATPYAFDSFPVSEIEVHSPAYAVRSVQQMDSWGMDDLETLLCNTY